MCILLHFQFGIQFKVKTEARGKKRTKEKRNHMKKEPSEKMRLLTYCSAAPKCCRIAEAARIVNVTKTKTKRKKHTHIHVEIERREQQKNAQPKRSTKYNIRINCFRFH